jgi:hypothetical protein
MTPPLAIVRAVQSVRRALGLASRRLAPPEYALVEIVTGKWRAAALEAVTRLGVADALYERPRDVAGLAAELGLDEGALYRVLRALASDGLLAQAGRSFALTAVTRPLASRAPNSMRHAVLSAGSGHHRSLWANFERGLVSGRPVFDELYGETFWQHLAGRPEVAAEFDASMAEYTRAAAPLLAAGYDFGRFATLVDVGGGSGELLATVLAAHPRPGGVLFDLPHAARGAPATFARFGVAARAAVVEGSAFENVPAGHDAYLLKNVVHEMTDEAALVPLGHVRQSIAPGGKLFVVENVVPEGGGPYLQFLDLVMLLGSGGRERTRAEFAALLGRAGFRLERVVETASPLSLLVAAPA